MQHYRTQRNYGCRIHDQYTYFGMRTLVMENDLVRISMLLDKGTEIYELLYKPKDLDFMWLSENGVQNPNRYLSTSADPIAAFIDYYPGGWQEVFPNGGPTSHYLGAQYGQHGEVAHMPWDYDIVEDTPEKIQVRLRVRTKKAPFQLTKWMTLSKGSSALTIQEEVENLSDIEMKYMWGQHLVFGKPFMNEHAAISMPDNITIITEQPSPDSDASARIKRGELHKWPLVPGNDGATVDLSRFPDKGTASDIIYLTGFDKKGWYEIENHASQVGIRVEWDAAAFPYLWYWQEFGATTGYPWYGRHQNIGLEPFTSYPTHGLEEAIRNGSAATITPRGRKTFEMVVQPYAT